MYRIKNTEIIYYSFLNPILLRGELGGFNNCFKYSKIDAMS